jgi:hypothetical protein
LLQKNRASIVPVLEDIRHESQSAQYSARVTKFKKTLRNGLLKVRRSHLLGDWIDDRTATRQIQELQEKYAPLVTKAEKHKDWDERERILTDWAFESDSVLHPLYARKAERLSAKARKYGITVPPQPRNNDENEDWHLSHVYGFWLPSVQLEQRLRNEIKSERSASYDEFRKWATLAFAVAGFLLAFYAVRAAKQPDPCSRNYYRSDSGECVFALKQVPQVSKPSPVREPARPRP